MQTQILKTSDEKAISLAVEYIQSGKIVAFPTDTVYGIGVSVKSIEGITQLYIVKRREKHKAIPLLIGKIEDLETIAGEISFDTQKLADAFWPGALTLVVPRNPALPENLSPYPTVGVRMPDHLFILSLLKKTGALAATSANLSGHTSPATATEVLEQLNGRIPLILDGGRTPGGTASTVVDCTKEKPEILREGPITSEEIYQVLLK
jgi:L-threonylcarbamoyladenylate synthase